MSSYQNRAYSVPRTRHLVRKGHTLVFNGQVYHAGEEVPLAAVYEPGLRGKIVVVTPDGSTGTPVPEALDIEAPEDGDE